MGLNNTNTPNSTPTASDNPETNPTPAMPPTPPSSTPAFSGSAPMTNPFSSQNSIPSSATGDIILNNPDQPKKTKKPLIIAIIIVVLLVGGLIATLILTRPKNNSSSATPSPETAPVSLDDLRSSFDILANIVISSEQSSSTPNLSLDPTNWQITKISNNSSSSTQKTYSESLDTSRNTFYAQTESYISQNSESNLSEFGNTSSLLNDRIVATTLYLRGNKFSTDLPSIYLKTPNNINEIIDQELSLDYGTTDELSTELISYIYSYYEQIVERTKAISEGGCTTDDKIDDSCVSRLRADYGAYQRLRRADDAVFEYASLANTTFTSLVASLPDPLKIINNFLGAANE